MSQTGILSFQNTLNYGALLQNYALYRIIGDIADDVVVINYRSYSIERFEGLVPRADLRGILRYLYLRKKARLFESFKKRITFSPSYTRDELIKHEGDFSRIIVGSDQVWNTDITKSDPTYFLDFIKEPERCKTYAASMGFNEIPDCGFDVRSLISHFSSILVRENSAAKAIGEGCPDAVPAHVVLDPTLLVEKSVWQNLERLPGYAEKAPYVLVYDVSESDSAIEAARHLSEGAHVVRIKSYKLRGKPGVKSVLNVSPEEYLGLFAHAQATVVSSFHGLCFSIINHRDFYFSGQTAGKNTNSRATDLMEALGISGRTVQDLANGTVKPVDWDDVEARLSALRAESLRLLKESLADLED